MAWRNARLGILHAARDAGAGAFSAANALGSGDLDDLADDRAGFFVEFATAETDHTIILDRGAGALEGTNRLYIPEGHNLSGVSIRVRGATDAAITTGVVTLLASTPAPATAVDEAFVFTSSLRYLELAFLTSSTPRLAEIVYTRTRETTRGVRPDWTDSPVDHVAHLETTSGAAYHLLLGPDGREIALGFAQAEDATDLEILEELFAQGTGRAVLLDPPYDDEAAVWATITSRERRNENPTPAVGSKRVSYSFTAAKVLA